MLVSEEEAEQAIMKVAAVKVMRDFKRLGCRGSDVLSSFSSVSKLEVI